MVMVVPSIVLLKMDTVVQALLRTAKRSCQVVATVYPMLEKNVMTATQTVEMAVPENAKLKMGTFVPVLQLSDHPYVFLKAVLSQTNME